MAKSKEQPKEQQQQEAKQQPQQQQQQPKQQPKQPQPKEQQQPKKTRPKAPSVKRITMEYFMKFNTSSNKKSWIKETLEKATKEPIMISNLTRGQIIALINQIDKHNLSSDRKIAYKYDVKRGIVLLAPKQAITQMEGGKK